MPHRFQLHVVELPSVIMEGALAGTKICLGSFHYGNQSLIPEKYNVLHLIIIIYES